MELDRRNFTFGAAAAAALSGGIAGASRPAFAALDEDELMQAGPLGEMALGAEDAPVRMIEYASMTCPHCAAFHIMTWPAIKEKYVETGVVRFIFREFPFDDAALVAFMVARCAGDKKYFGMVDVLFEQQQVWLDRSRNILDELFKIARLAGFSQDSFQECIRNEDIARGVRAVKDRASLEFGVRSTPTFFINGERVEGNLPIAKFDEIIGNIVG